MSKQERTRAVKKEVLARIQNLENVINELKEFKPQKQGAPTVTRESLREKQNGYKSAHLNARITAPRQAQAGKFQYHKRVRLPSRPSRFLRKPQQLRTNSQPHTISIAASTVAFQAPEVTTTAEQAATRHSQRQLQKQIMRAARGKTRFSNPTNTKPASRNKVSKRRKKSQTPCSHYNRTGECRKGDACLFEHDPNKVSICPKFLKGNCRNLHCLLKHEYDPNKMPVCSFFLKGRCTNDACRYLHVKVRGDAALCKDFVNGYCPRGKECTLLHLFATQQRTIIRTNSNSNKNTNKHAQNGNTDVKESTDVIGEAQVEFADVIDENGEVLFTALPLVQQEDDQIDRISEEEEEENEDDEDNSEEGGNWSDDCSGMNFIPIPLYNEQASAPEEQVGSCSLAMIEQTRENENGEDLSAILQSLIPKCLR